MSVVSEVKQRKDHSQIFDFNKSKVKRCREASLKFHFKRKQSKTA